MSLMEFAIKNERWDLAAHIIVLAAARAVGEEVKRIGKERKKETGRTQK
jgi:hypothetical protein